MLRHVVLLTLAVDAPEGRAQEIATALQRLPAEIPEIRTYVVGVDAGLADGNAHVLVDATFDDESAWRAYTGAPAHVAVIDELIRPVLASRSAVQLRL